mmetsp:Transcript_1945/g.2604  ORF Transcript_1945/g.2604 Transcript_1945/m.2604 type:complete len:87 (-) Transcript_1945:231-491(-)|eukprot:CAMPEP_0194034750 /NCGR_PEP_ID=MMETSP0009_2-20130614/7173_1 /TAXON_ID=210454 /ORGANISM="Grammatophora oceanica, Strain CCMP 410" /LENGTH=86 /DNA_ID=CAMNT_0038675799 /DNA_START=449 /DNA_END=709 /DNA_ORIENTATION=+
MVFSKILRPTALTGATTRKMSTITAVKAKKNILAAGAAALAVVSMSPAHHFDDLDCQSYVSTYDCPTHNKKRIDGSGHHDGFYLGD